MLVYDLMNRDNFFAVVYNEAQNRYWYLLHCDYRGVEQCEVWDIYQSEGLTGQVDFVGHEKNMTRDQIIDYVLNVKKV